MLSRMPRSLQDAAPAARPLVFALVTMLTSSTVAAQDAPRRLFAGALFGVSALSGDARTVTSGADAAVSLYDPGNGPAVNAFAGFHAAHYFSVQINWMCNRNDLTLFSSTTSPAGFSEQQRASHQHAVVFDALVYFRRLDSVIRPYLGTGLSVLQFSSDEAQISMEQGPPLPAGDIDATRLGLRSHVGIDVAVSRRFVIRYSFSETISGNPISESLSPPGQRGLMNFQNLFGIVSRF
jgi:outer membrane protein W